MSTTDSSSESVIFVGEEYDNDAVIADDPNDCVVMFVRHCQRMSKKTPTIIPPRTSARLKNRTLDGAAICNQTKPPVHSDLCTPLSPDSQPDTDGKNCAILSATLNRDCSDKSVQRTKRRKRLVLRKPKCVSPSASELTKLSCVHDESLPDLCILESDSEDSSLSTAAMVDGTKMSVSVIAASTDKTQHTDEELLPDLIDITECTCGENPWLCDKCVAELNNWKTSELHEEPAVDSTEQKVSVGALLPSPAVQQEGLGDETNQLSKTFLAQIENSKTETGSKCSASVVAQFNNAKTETINKCSANVAQIANVKTESVNKSSASVVTQLEKENIETINKCSASVVAQLESANTETVDKCSTTTTDHTGQYHRSHVSAPVISHDDLCQSKCSFNYVVKSSSDTGVVLAKKLVVSTEHRCTCRETKGLCPSCTATLNKSWSEARSRDCARITSDTTFLDVRVEECTCDKINGLCSVCVARLDGSKRGCARKRPTSATNTTTKYTFSQTSPLQAISILRNVIQECSCDKGTGICRSCITKMNNSKSVTATTTIVKDLPASQQLHGLKRPYGVIESSASAMVGNVSVLSKKQRLASISSQPSSSMPVMSGSGRYKCQFKCLGCGIMVATSKLLQCANGHRYCHQCVQDLVKHTVYPNECLYPQCRSMIHISTDGSRKPPPKVIIKVGDKLDQEHIETATRNMLRDMSNHHGEGCDSDDELPVFNNCQMVDALTLPKDWESMDINGDMKTVSILPESVPFKSVALMFQATMPPSCAEIVSIRRVQNPILWQFYSVRRKQMVQQNGAGQLNEMKLFHGTSSNLIEAISKNNFDWRLCGKHGTAYGHGSYFASRAEYSHAYTDRDHHIVTSLPNMLSQMNGLPGPSFASLAAAMARNLPWLVSPVALPMQAAGKRRRRQKAPRRASMPQPMSSAPVLTKHTMFVARVLVGRYTAGKSTLRKPPPLNPRDPYGKCYDSCVDNHHTPNVFVIFESSQCYPEYIIEYTSTKR